MLLNIPKWPPIKPNITDTYFKMPRNKILLPIKQKRNQTRPDHCVYHRSTWYRLCKRLIQCSRGLAFDFSMTRLIFFGLCEILSKDEKTLLSQNITVFGLHVFRHYNIWHSFKYSSRDDYSLSPFLLLIKSLFWFGLLLFDQSMVSPKSSAVQGYFFVHCIIILNTGIYRWLQMDFYM